MSDISRQTQSPEDWPEDLEHEAEHLEEIEFWEAVLEDEGVQAYIRKRYMEA